VADPADQPQAPADPAYDLVPVDHAPEIVDPTNGWSALPAPHGVPQITIGRSPSPPIEPAPYDLVPVDHVPQFADGPIPKAGKTIQPVAVGRDIAAMPGKVADTVGDLTGVTDAARALRGEMTPEEAQMFALGALPAMVAPEARAAKPAMTLAMDEASRMARAADMGFTVPAYHGTTSAFDQFGRIEGGNARGEGYYFSTSPEAASRYAIGDVNRISPKGDVDPNVMPVLLNMQKPFDESAMLSRADLQKVEKTLIANGEPWKKGELINWFDRAYQPTGSNVLESAVGYDPDKQNALLRQLGYDGRIGYSVNPDADTARDIVVFSPEQVRSRFAAFDPRESKSANLLHAAGGRVPRRGGGGDVGRMQSTIAPLAQALDQAVPNFDPSDWRPSTNIEDVRDKPEWQRVIETVTRKPMFGGTDNPFGAANRAAGGRVEPANIDRNPTPAQAKSGNYAKDHIHIHGLPITIENAKGSMRRGVGKDGKPWESRLSAHYGYFKKSEGADGDHLDVYLGDHRKSPHVYVVDQVDAVSKRFDEHKVLLNFGSERQATNTYCRAFSDGKGADRIGKITGMTVAQFKEWLQNGDTEKPFSHVVGRKERVREILERHGIGA
jgi:hypothetical protein